jgi:adenosylhomocysteinase
VIANAGHFNVEINIPALEELSESVSRPRESVQEYTLRDGRVVRLLAEGRLVNLAAAEGHPSAVMDMSFANQVLTAIHIASQRDKLENRVHSIPAEIDAEVALMKLQSMNIHIDALTDEQQHYLASWQEGT